MLGIKTHLAFTVTIATIIPISFPASCSTIALTLLYQLDLLLYTVSIYHTREEGHSTARDCIKCYAQVKVLSILQHVTGSLRLTLSSTQDVTQFYNHPSPALHICCCPLYLLPFSEDTICTIITSI